MVFVEAELIADRVNNDHATAAVLLQLAVSSLFSKKGGDGFRKQIRQLTGT